MRNQINSDKIKPNDRTFTIWNPIDFPDFMAMQIGRVRKATIGDPWICVRHRQIDLRGKLGEGSQILIHHLYIYRRRPSRWCSRLDNQLLPIKARDEFQFGAIAHSEHLSMSERTYTPPRLWEF